MRKRNNPTLIGTLATIAWLALAIWSYYTRDPVVEWTFISVMTILIVAAIIEGIKNYAPRHYRRRKHRNLHT